MKGLTVFDKEVRELLGFAVAQDIRELSYKALGDLGGIDIICDGNPESVVSGKTVIVLEIVHVIIGKWRRGVLHFDFAIDNLCLKTVQALSGGLGLEVSDLGADSVGGRVENCCGSHGVQLTVLEACGEKIV